jgi:predicted nucleotidyltransferase
MVSPDVLKQAVTEVARANGALCAILFGSYARGTATRHSDIDLIFVENTSEPFLARLDRYLGPLVDRLKTGVETLVYTPDEFQRLRERPFLKHALATGVVLYESGNIPP